jgi:hypothetical protein
MTASQILLAMIVFMLAGMGSVLLALPSGRALLFRRDVYHAARAGGRPSTGCIRVVEGALSGLEVPLSQPVVLGRDPDQAQVVFPADDTTVSRRHCDIRFDSTAGLFEVRDLGSSNGTFVVAGAEPPRRLPGNGRERLSPGQNILIGSPKNRLVLVLAR